MPIFSKFKSSGMNWSDQTKRGQDFTRIAGRQALEGVKEGGDWWNKECRKTGMALFGSKSTSRKAASAMIAKIPFPLAQYLARCFKSQTGE
jgi:hypothetical protein